MNPFEYIIVVEITFLLLTLWLGWFVSKKDKNDKI